MLEPEGIFVGQMREWIVIEPRVSAAPAGDANPSIDTANAASNATATNRDKRDVSISILLLEQRPPIPPASVHTGSPRKQPAKGTFRYWNDRRHQKVSCITS